MSNFMRFVGLALLIVGLGGQEAFADLIYQTAGVLRENVPVGSLSTTGTPISNDFYSGGLFTVQNEVRVGAIGAHASNRGSVGESVFGAILELDSSTEIANFADAVIVHTLIEFGASRATETIRGNVSVDLVPGQLYGVFFGTGLFGATANPNVSSLIQTLNGESLNSDTGQSAKSFRLSDGRLIGQSGNGRVFVESVAVPEPSAAISLSLISACWFCRRRKAS